MVSLTPTGDGGQDARQDRRRWTASASIASIDASPSSLSSSSLSLSLSSPSSLSSESSSEDKCASMPSRPKASSKSRAPSWVPSLLKKSSGNSQTVLVASGFGAAFRVGRHLANGQVVVLRGPHEFDEWYYPLLTPWVDFVPVRLGGDDDSSLVAALERLARNATLRSYISRNARCFWKRHFGHVDDIMRRFVCGLSARQRKSNY